MRTWNKAAFLFAAVCLGCSSSMMTMTSFSEIPMGTTGEEIKKVAGTPYSIEKKKDGTVEYKYIERLKNGFRTIEERHYVIILRDDRVIEKRVEQSSEPPYRLNSYDLQTTYGDEVSSLDDEDQPEEE